MKFQILKTHPCKNAAESPTNPKAMTMTGNIALQGNRRFHIRRSTQVLLSGMLAICALVVALLPGMGHAAATASAVKQDIPGLADTPGSKPSVANQMPLSISSLSLQNGLAQIDSALILKIYFYAYSDVPVDYRAILTANTENIIVPPQIQPGEDQRRVIDDLIKVARMHPDVLIKVDDIGLSLYDTRTQSFQWVNHIFVTGTRYYFDNSAYRYVYDETNEFQTLRCADAKMIELINADIEKYKHFEMDIRGRVIRADPGTSEVTIELNKVALKNGRGEVLITQNRR